MHCSMQWKHFSLFFKWLLTACFRDNNFAPLGKNCLHIVLIFMQLTCSNHWALLWSFLTGLYAGCKDQIMTNDMDSVNGLPDTGTRLSTQLKSRRWDVWLHGARMHSILHMIFLKGGNRWWHFDVFILQISNVGSSAHKIQTGELYPLCIPKNKMLFFCITQVQ